MILVGCASAFAYMLALYRVPDSSLSLLTAISSDPLVILLMLNLILLVLGMIMDMAALILICTPIFLPVVTSLGMDPVQFGIILMMNLGLGLCTPPVGACLFVGCAIGGVKIEQAVKTIWPFYLAIFVALMLVTYVPALSLTLPHCDANRRTRMLEKLLMTGAAGGVGQALRPLLPQIAQSVVLSDIVEIDDLEPHETFRPATLRDRRGGRCAVRGRRRHHPPRRHFGREAVRSDPQRQYRRRLQSVRGRPAPRQAAHRLRQLQPCHRLLPARSAHRSSVLPKPDTLYGVSKAFGENLASLYFDKFGQECLSVRIGWCFPKPRDRRMLATWLAVEDLCDLCARAFAAPRLGHTIVYGASDNDESGGTIRTPPFSAGSPSTARHSGARKLMPPHRSRSRTSRRSSFRAAALPPSAIPTTKAEPATMPAPTDQRCGNQAFNITNGDYFRWRNLWPKIADVFEMPVGAIRRRYPSPSTWPTWRPLWEDISNRHQLTRIPYADLVAWPFADYVFGADWDVMSDVTKARLHGFHDVVDSEAMFVRLLRRFRDERIVP